MKKAEIEEVIEDIEHHESELSNWERQFIDSVNAQLAKDNGISVKQEDKLLEIWERVT